MEERQFEFVHGFPADEPVLGMCRYRDKLVVATVRGVYIADNVDDPKEVRFVLVHAE